MVPIYFSFMLVGLPLYPDDITIPNLDPCHIYKDTVQNIAEYSILMKVPQLSLTFHISVKKSESILVGGHFNEVFGNDGYDKYSMEVVDNLYVGKVSITTTSQPKPLGYDIVLRKRDLRMYAIFSDDDKQYVIEPLDYNATATDDVTDPSRIFTDHRLIIAPKSYLRGLNLTSGNEYYPIGGITWNQEKDFRIIKKRSVKEKFIVETTIHVPLFKVNTGIQFIPHIIAQVNQILKYPHLNVDISLKIAGLFVYPENQTWDNNMRRTYEKFTGFKTNNFPDIDLSILIIRLPLISQKEVEEIGVTGFKHMCIPSFSVMVVQDEGFEMATTIAHELGHLLGARHDSHTRCHTNEKRGIMHYGSIGVQKHKWSRCSAAAIHNFTSSPLVDCLRKNSTHAINSQNSQLPGSDLFHDQCRVSLNDELAGLSQRRSDCTILRCYSKGKIVTLKTPPFDGTPCFVCKITNQTRLTSQKNGGLCFRGRCSSQMEIFDLLKIDNSTSRNESCNNAKEITLCLTDPRFM